MRQAQDQAAQARPLCRRSRVHAAGRAPARALRARVDAHHPRGGPGVPRLALGAGRQLLPVGDGEGGGAGASPDLHRPAEGRSSEQQEFERRLYLIRKVVSNALHYAYKDRDIGHYTVSLSSRTLVYKGMFLSYQVKAYYTGPVGPARRLGDGAGASALLHQHLPVVEAGASLPHGRPQRRDQHAARQRQLDGGAAGVGVLAAVRRRHLQAVADLLRGPVRHGVLRQRARIPGDGRLQPLARRHDADPRSVGRQPADGWQAPRLLRVSRLPDGAVGRPGRHGLHRRPPDRRHARPQRPAAGALSRHQGRPGDHVVGGRRAAGGRGEHRQEVAAAAGQDAADRPGRRPHHLR